MPPRSILVANEASPYHFVAPKPSFGVLSGLDEDPTGLALNGLAGR